MDDDSKNTEGQISGEDSALQQANEMEEIIELVDAVPADEEQRQAMGTPKDETGLGGEPEDVIDLTDVVKESSENDASDDAASEGQPDDVLSLEEEVLEDDGVIELVDEVGEPELEPQPPVELTDVAEDQDLRAEEDLPETALGAEETVLSATASLSTDKMLESAILEGLSEERIEAVLTRVVKETIEKKADRIILEVAEAAIAKEIEKIKQAL